MRRVTLVSYRSRISVATVVAC